MKTSKGLNWDQITLRINRGTRVRCEPGWRLTPGWYDKSFDYDFWYVWAGRGEMRIRGQRHELRPGCCFWMRPGGDYIAEQDIENRLGVTAIHFDLLDPQGNVRQDLPIPGEAQQLPDVPYVGSVARRIWELSIPLKADAALSDQEALLAGSLLKCLLVEYEAAYHQQDRDAPAGTQRRQRRQVQAIASQIVESPAEAPPVADMARSIGYSPDHFARVFRQVIGQSPQEYVVAARISRASQLLIETDLTVSQIADLLGYSDVYFFSKQFKQQTGQTPTKFRKHSF